MYPTLPEHEFATCSISSALRFFWAMWQTFDIIDYVIDLHVLSKFDWDQIYEDWGTHIQNIRVQIFGGYLGKNAIVIDFYIVPHFIRPDTLFIFKTILILEENRFKMMMMMMPISIWSKWRPPDCCWDLNHLEPVAGWSTTSKPSAFQPLLVWSYQYSVFKILLSPWWWVLPSQYPYLRQLLTVNK